MTIEALISAYFRGPLPEWHDKDGAAVPADRVLREYDAVKTWLLDDDAPGAIVAINLDHDYRFLLCVLACMETGTAYLPLRPSWPAARIAQIEALTKFSRLIDAANFETVAAHPRGKGRVRKASPESPLYVMCTSGSTGEPKPVVIPRRAYEAFLKNVEPIYSFLPEGSRLLFISDFTFDFSLHDAALLLLRRAAPFFSRFAGNVFDLAFELETWRIAAAGTVPNNIRLLLRDEVLKRADLSALKCLVSGGAAVTPALLRRMREALPTSCELFNIYGPTEATVCTHIKRFSRSGADESGGHVSVGKPLAGVLCRLVGETGAEIASPRATGELWLGGPQLMTGYLGSRTEQGLHRTGDLAFRDERGEYYIVGRAGETLKRKGYRVNLLDIDAYIQALPGVRDCATVAYPHPEADHVLVSCVVGDSAISKEDLVRQMRRTMLPYQIPDRVELLESLPTTESGKIDRPALESRFGLPAVPERAYRLLLTGIFAAGLIFHFGLKALGDATPREFIDDMNDVTDLRQHAIAARPPGAEPPIVLLGGSDMHFFSRPLDERFGGRVCNLSSLGGSILTMLAYLKLSEPYHPSCAIAAVSADMLLAWPDFSDAALAHPELLRGAVPDDIYQKLRPFSGWRHRAFAYLQRPHITFNNPIEDGVHEAAWSLRGLLYPGVPLIQRPLAPRRNDPYWGRASVGTLPLTRDDTLRLVSCLPAAASAAGVRLVLFFPPRHPDLDAEQTERLRLIKASLDRDGTPYLDYSDLFGRHREFFKDKMHMTIGGMKIVARRMEKEVR